MQIYQNTTIINGFMKELSVYYKSLKYMKKKLARKLPNNTDAI